MSGKKLFGSFLIAVLVIVPGPARAQQLKFKLDVTQFIIVGEGLSAGMADFGFRSVY